MMQLQYCSGTATTTATATIYHTTVPAVWCEYSPQFTYFFKTWKFLSNLHLRGIKVKSNVQKIFKFHVLKRKLEKSFTKP